MREMISSERLRRSESGNESRDEKSFSNRSCTPSGRKNSVPMIAVVPLNRSGATPTMA
jgi:hypothetical protein